MVISDLQYIESADKNIQGGIAFSDAWANAYASGRHFAATRTQTFANAVSYRYYSYASASSSSSAVAY
ncbi:hypothetical protein OsccyDRAFT_1771 [Leptolyngbyaceae cyanobacterium JSC-12]|nr:hypothetical protein OsccyDRAFT_1771 [Leptolyngbyaceae cyanobacterium JSC-12]